ncbi:MAG TPA: hypothetical protein VN428_27265 [Bryobacteraceae bacterium]|nr:hypothetical protein [Bryobacteraceae bacterium]
MNGAASEVDLHRHQRTALTVGGIGLLVTVLGFFFDAPQFFRSYLWAYWFWLGLGIGCLQMLMLFQLTGGAWGFVSQRVFEAAARTLPFMFILVIPLLFGITGLFPWATEQGQRELGHKSAYLNVPFLLVRLAIYFAVWGGIAVFFARWSRAADDNPDPRYLRLRKIMSGPGIVIVAFTASFAVVDWMMSLEPHWFSTVYPLIHIVGQVLAGLALSILVIAVLSTRPPLAGVVSVNALHDLGNLLLTFTVLWAYVQFSQLLITWAGNLPKEIIFYRHRLTGGWQYLGMFLIVAHFFVPFVLLLSRKTKRNRTALASVAAFILAMRLFDYLWLIEPAFHQGQFAVHWLDLAAPVGIGGLWVALFLWLLASRPLVAANDPRIVDALERA